MVVTVPEQKHGYQSIPAQRIGCCVIGIASGPEKPSYGHNDRSYGHNDRSYGHDDYGYDNSYDVPRHGHGRRDYW